MDKRNIVSQSNSGLLGYNISSVLDCNSTEIGQTCFTYYWNIMSWIDMRESARINIIHLIDE